MDFILRAFLAAVFSIITVISVARQQPEESLRLNHPKRVHLEAGQVHHYSLPLQKGQFASVKVDQESIGIGYAVYAPGDSLISYEDLNAIYQTEVINIGATKSGSYRIDIFWDYGRPQQGDYRITWTISESIGKTPPLRAAQLLKSWYDANEAGGTVVVLKNGKIVFKGAKGLGNLEHAIPITDNSPFELASCSKQFTGFAIATLLDKGLVSLQDDIRNYLPELPDFGKKITIENLVYHTSGLRNWDAMSNAMGLQPQDIVTLEMVYKMACSNKELNFIPGEKFSYTNTGYNLLAMIVEKVSGKSFGHWLNENVFVPLGMKNAVVREHIAQVIPHKVSSYKKGATGFTANTDNWAVEGSTSVYASINDLAAWVTNFDTQQAGTKGVFDLLNRKSKFNNGNPLDFYAFGNGFGNRKGIANIEHLGLVSGFRTAISRYPGQGVAVVFMSNDNNDATYSRAWAIADLFLENQKSKPLAPVKLPDLQSSLAQTIPYQTPICPVDTKDYEGVYYGDEINAHYKLINKDGVLTAISYRFDSIDLKWQSADKFTSNFQIFERNFNFLRDSGNLVVGFRLTGGGKEIAFKKMK